MDQGTAESMSKVGRTDLQGEKETEVTGGNGFELSRKA
jgi:hypothetical protein